MIEQAYQTISKVFSEEGFSQDGFSVKGESPFHLTLLHNSNGEIHIDFMETPIVCTFTKKFLFFRPQLVLNCIGIVLKPTKGLIKFKNFMDFPFDYQ